MIKKYFAATTSLTLLLLLTGCSALAIPEKPLANPEDVTSCGETGTALNNNLRIIRDPAISNNSQELLDSLIATDAIYVNEIAKTDNKQMKIMLQKLRDADKVVQDAIIAKQDTAPAVANMLLISKSWVAICTSLSDEN